MLLEAVNNLTQVSGIGPVTAKNCLLNITYQILIN